MFLTCENQSMKLATFQSPGLPPAFVFAVTLSVFASNAPGPAASTFMIRPLSLASSSLMKLAMSNRELDLNTTCWRASSTHKSLFLYTRNHFTCSGMLGKLVVQVEKGNFSTSTLMYRGLKGAYIFHNISHPILKPPTLKMLITC